MRRRPLKGRLGLHAALRLLNKVRERGPGLKTGPDCDAQCR